jgi:hypothetical protein
MTGNPNNRTILRPDHRLMEVCEGLRNMVENVNRIPDISLRNGGYKTLDKTSVFTAKCDGVTIGYKLEEHATFMRRKVFIKVPGYKIEDISDKEREAIMVAVMESFLDQQQGLPEIAQIAPDCMLIQQDFLPLYLIERKPNLVTLAGGVDVDDKGIIHA